MQMGKIVYIYHWDRIRAQIEMAQTELGSWGTGKLGNWAER